MKHFTLISSLLVLLVAAGCKDTFPPGPGDGGGNQGAWKNITWHLTSYRTSDGVLHKLPGSVDATVRFSDSGTLSGNNSCNQYGAEYTAGDSTISMTNFVQTEMYCIDVAEIEKAFMEGLGQASRFKVTTTSFHLYAPGGRVVELNFGNLCPPPPDGAIGGIVYNSYEGSPEVFGVTRIDRGGFAVRLGEGYVSSSPFGGHLAWAYGGPSIVMKWQAVVSNVSGSDLRAIYPHLETGWQVQPGTVALSPNGKAVAFGVENLIVVPPLATVELRVSLSPSDTGTPAPHLMAPTTTPAFSPNGRKVAWYGVGGVVWVADIDDLLNPQQIATNAVTFFHGYGKLAWSPDGSSIVYLGLDATLTSSDLYLVDASGTGAPKNLTSDAERETSPVFSPKGDFVAFSAGDPYPNRLCMVKASGTGPKDYLYDRDITVVYYDLFPQWSLDGKRLLFTTYTQMPNVAPAGQLQWLDLKTRVATKIVDNAGPGFYER